MTYTLFKLLEKFQSLIFIYLYPLWEPCAILKQQKEKLLTLSIERKTCMEAMYYTATKTYITLSIERKVSIIGVKIRQATVKI